MQLATFLDFLQSSWLATLVDGSRYISMAIQIVHILAFTFLLGLVLAFNIRVQRLSLLTLPVNNFAHALYRPYWIALLVAVVAGILLFLPRAMSYSNNVPFIWKMGFLLVAGFIQFLLLKRAFVLPAASDDSSGAFALPATSVGSLGAEDSLSVATGGFLSAGTGGTSLRIGAISLPAITETSLLFRTFSLLSLLLWLFTGVAGRAIGFV